MSKQQSVFSIFILLFISIFSITGCGLKFPEFFPEEVPISSLPPKALFIDKDAIYNKTVEMIKSAETSIYIEQAVFDDPNLIQLLISKSKSGVDIKVLLDQWQKANRSTKDQLKRENISVQFYPAQKGQINHTKYLVVDQKQALIYGPSWTETGFNSHDLAVELSGRSAWQTATVFSKDWEFTTTFPLDVPKTSELPSDNIVLAKNANVRQQLIEQIKKSTQSIWIENSEVTDPDLVQALCEAAQNKCDVRLILDSSKKSSTTSALEALTSSGVQIRFFPAELPLGMNLAVFDASTFVMSSSGWTSYSFLANHEFSITVPSPSASGKLTELFNSDWDKSGKD